MTFGKPRRRTVDEDQRILPLINVVFLLLIFFMVAGQLSKTDPVEIEPPASDSDNQPGDRLIQVLIAADGRVLIDGDTVPSGAIARRLRDVSEELGAATVHIKADGNADAVAVIAVMEAARESGAMTIKLLTAARRAP